jgi:thiamine kinase-like enzyme
MFRELLDHLDAEPGVLARTWREWRITPIAGGMNNLICRASGAEGDFAVKWTVRDERDRAGREYAALQALHKAGLSIAPQAVWLDRECYRQPVIVQTWLDGEVLTGPPQTDAEWDALLRHYCMTHTITPSRSAVALPEAVLNAASGAAGKLLVQQQLDRLPGSARPPSLQVLITEFDRWSPPAWPTPPRALCHVDPNWRNFLRHGDGLAAVDWENSGWGDPAFELADMMAHPGYIEVAPARWDWLIAAYAEQNGDRTATLRIRTYYTVMLIWWVVRLARYLYEVPRDLDQRLVKPSPDWQATTERNYARYAALAEQHLATLR